MRGNAWIPLSLLTLHESSVGSTATLSNMTQFSPSLIRLASTFCITGSLTTVLSVYTPILALLRSDGGRLAIMLERSWPTSFVAPTPKRRFEAAIYANHQQPYQILLALLCRLTSKAYSVLPWGKPRGTSTGVASPR